MKFKKIPELTVAEVAAFWLLVDSAHGENECWPWTGPTSKAKYGAVYGVVNIRGCQYKPHRVAYTLEVGSIPAGLTIDHVAARGCVSKLCCNPAHLEPVTSSENTLRYQRTVLKSSSCKFGHNRPIGQNCGKCRTLAVAKSMAKQPEKYREMKRLQKRKERARLKLNPEVIA